MSNNLVFNLDNLNIDVVNSLTLEQKKELVSLIEAKQQYIKYNKNQTFFNTPIVRAEHYPKHIQFMQMGATKRSRLFCAANRVGKTVTGAFEVICHATGIYPDWWEGKRFNRPVTIWVAGESSISTRDVIQFELLGSYNDLGSGMIPKHLIAGKPKVKSGVAECVDTIRVKNVFGGESNIVFKSFEQGRSKFQGTSIDVVWLDEEVPDEVYEECVYRTATTKGIIILTYTPFKGYTEIIKMHKDSDNQSKYIINVGWDDGVPHLSAETKKELLEGTHPAFIEVRTKGIPSLGAGAVYPVPEKDIIVDDFAIPAHWRKAYAMDVGWNKTAVLWGAIDDNDIIYFYSEHYAGRQEPPVHAEAVRSRGEWIKGVIDPASRGRSQKDGSQLFSEYLKLGLDLSLSDNAVHAGIQMVWQLMISGKLKIMRSLTNLIDEIRQYQFDEHGKIKKEKDHLCDCLKYYVLSARSIAHSNVDLSISSLFKLPQNENNRSYSNDSWMS
jgi:phage terminase large subunit-like protein